MYTAITMTRSCYFQLQRAGLEELKVFLEGTNGMDLFNFWLDCETFKDTMADHDEIMKMASRNQLFR